MRQYLFAIVFSALMLSSLGLCAQVGFVQKGEASYYASQFHGRPTASGERYNKNMLTASHKKLPFGTKVKVTNLANSKSVVVRINDRGPYVPRRIIDVSLAAATELDMLRAGIAPVKIEVIEEGDGSTTPQGLPESTVREDRGDDNRNEVVLPEDDMDDDADDTRNESDVQKGAQFEEGDGAVEEDEPAFVYRDDKADNVEPADNAKRERLPAWSVGGTFDAAGNQRFPNGYTIQVGAFGAKENAQRKVRELSNRGFEDAYIQVIRSGNGVLYKVVVGAYSSEAQARRLQDQLTEARFYGFLSKHLR